MKAVTSIPETASAPAAARRATLAAMLFAAALAAACGGDGGPTAPSTMTTTTTTSNTPSSKLLIPGEYYLDTVRTCGLTACGTRAVPTALFTSSANGVAQMQLRGVIRLNGDRTFYFESVQRTDSDLLGSGPNQTHAGGGGFDVSDTQISFKSLAGQVGPGMVTINADGTLTRSYNINIEPPFQPQTIVVTELYRTVR